MKSIDTWIQALTEQEYRDLSTWIGRERKEMTSLLKAWRQGLSDPDAHQQVVPGLPRQGFYVLKSRVTEQIESFFLHRAHQRDVRVQIASKIALAETLFGRNLESEGWKILLDAERLARQSGVIRMLAWVHEIQLEYAHTPSATSFTELKSRCAENSRKLNQEFESNLVRAEVMHTLMHSKEQGNALISAIAPKHQASPQDFHLMQLVIRELNNRQDFTGLIVYCRQSIKAIEEQGPTLEHTHRYVIQLHFALCYALFRQGYFERYQNALLELRDELFRFSKQHSPFYPRWNIMMAELEMYTGHAEMAESRLRQTANGTFGRMSAEDAILVKCNLIPAMYLQGKVHEVVRDLGNFRKSEPDLDRVLGTEGRLHLLISEAIAHYENRDEDHARNILQEIRSRFRAPFRKRLFLNEQAFVSWFDRCLRKSQVGLSEKDLRKFTICNEEVYPGSIFMIQPFAWALATAGLASYGNYCYRGKT